MLKRLRDFFSKTNQVDTLDINRQRFDIQKCFIKIKVFKSKSKKNKCSCKPSPPWSGEMNDPSFERPGVGCRMKRNLDSNCKRRTWMIEVTERTRVLIRFAQGKLCKGSQIVVM